nr:TPD1 protein homolog 1-like [Tanacetum cinerariifolium]
MPYSHQVRKRHYKSGTKSNAIFAPHGHGSTSSVGRKSNAIFASGWHYSRLGKTTNDTRRVVKTSPTKLCFNSKSEACGLMILQEPTDRPGQLAVYLGNPSHSCALEHVKLTCTGFTSRMEIDTKTLPRHGDLCIVNNDKPVPRLSFVSFSYDCRGYYPFALANETVTCS